MRRAGSGRAGQRRIHRAAHAGLSQRRSFRGRRRGDFRRRRRATRGVISQGCTPIGETWTLTKVEQNFIHQIGNRPAYEVLAETFNDLSPEEQQQSARQPVHRPGDERIPRGFSSRRFSRCATCSALTRSPACIAIGALPRIGQTIQFQRRDAAGGDRGHAANCSRAPSGNGGATIYGGCLCSCNGRGRSLFGAANHDARMIQERARPGRAWPDFSATAKSARSAKRIFSTASLRRWRCS